MSMDKNRSCPSSYLLLSASSTHLLPGRCTATSIRAQIWCASLTGVHFNWRRSQMCWRCGLRIPSEKGSSAMSDNQEKHSGHPAHRSKSGICIFILTWLEHYYTTRRPLRYRYRLLNVARYKLKLLIEAVFFSLAGKEGGVGQPHK